MVISSRSASLWIFTWKCLSSIPRQKYSDSSRYVKGPSTRKDLTTTDVAPSELFHYGVMICTTCRYAVQPGAIRRHLKDIHYLYHEKRYPYMVYTQGLKLKRPEDVQTPPAADFPIPQLPVEKGWRCMVKGCNSMCASTKRMKNHCLPSIPERVARGPNGGRLCYRPFSVVECCSISQDIINRSPRTQAIHPIK